MKRPRRVEDLEIRSVDRDVLVYDRTNDKVHILNKTASDILQLCDGTRSPGDIAQFITESKGIDMPDATRDVESILGNFYALNLVGESQFVVEE